MRVVFLSLCLVTFVIGNPVKLDQPAPEDRHLDLVQLVADLFSARDDRAVTNENEEEEAATDEGRDKEIKLTEITDKKLHKKYNALVDDVYKGMNERLKSGGMDPMVLNINKARANLDKQQKKKEENKALRKAVHGVEKREVVDDEESIDLETADEAIQIKDDKHKNKTKYQKNKKNKKDYLLNKNKKNKNKDNKREGKSQKREMGSLSGIASLKRDGDVSVYRNQEGTDIIKSEFTLGPLSLEVTKTDGGVGKAQNIKIARAVTEKLKGKMVIKVKADGSTHVKSVKFEKPQQVDVRGSLGLKKEESSELATQSINKIRPVAAQRLLKIARSIIRNKTN